MKRFLCILLIAAAVIGLMTTTAMAEEYATVYSGNGYPVRLRSGPSKSYNPIASYNVGTTVIVLQRDASWSQLKIGDVQGWMMNEFLRFGTTGTIDPSTGQEAGETATVTSGNGLKVWLRTTANGKRIALYAPGTQVTVLTKGDKWSYISIAGVRGYMMTKFLSFAPPPEPASLEVQSVKVNYPAPVVGDELTASVTPESATVTYSWIVDGVVQSTTNSLRVLDAYKGKTVTVRVTGSGVYYGTKQYTTDPVTNELSVTSVELSKPEPFVGDTISAVIKPSSATVTYSWRVGGTEVSTDATYTVRESDVGKLIQLKVVGKERFEGVAICSAAQNVRSDKEIYGVELNIKNRNVLVGEVLSATLQPSGASAKYTWMADGETVATTASYKVTANDLGKKITLKVEGTSPYTGSATTEAYGVVKQATLTAVKLSKTKLAKGDTVSAVLTPSTATATYQWYTIKDDGDPVEITGETESSLEIKAAYVDQKIVVRALGSGIYTVANTDGYIQSAASDKVTSAIEITAVAIDNTAPVVGDVLTAQLSPDEIDDPDDPNVDYSKSIGYIWTVGNEVLPQSTNRTYTVLQSDIGKTIRVQAIGNDTATNPVSGKATSAWTKAVVDTLKLTGVQILINNGTDNMPNAASTAPQPEQWLVPSVTPIGAQEKINGQKITYTWMVDGKPVSYDETLEVYEGWVGKQIVLIVEGATGSAYTGKVSATTAAVAKLEAVNVELTITDPAAGKTPQTSVKGKHIDKNGKATTIDITGTIQWLDGNDQDWEKVAELDDKGHFKPETLYAAKLTLKSASSSLGWIGAKVTVNGEVQQGDSSNVFIVTFKPTTDTAVTNYFISGIPKPVPGAKAEKIEINTDQYKVDVTWEPSVKEGDPFPDATEYKAKIKLTAQDGYTFDGVPVNAFTVSGATSTTSEAGSRDTLTVTATYKVDRKMIVTADRSTVYVDGTKDVIIQCFAEMTNKTEQPTDFVWSVEQAQSTITKMDAQTGKLIVGRDEKVDKKLIVRAKWTDPDTNEPYEVKAEITVANGTEESTDREVVFVGAAPIELAPDDTAQYKAFVKNSQKGVEWTLEGRRSGNTLINQEGILKVSPEEQADSINVVATSIEDPSVYAKIHVKIIRKYTVRYVNSNDELIDEHKNLSYGEETPKCKGTFDPTEWTPTWQLTVEGNTTYKQKDSNSGGANDASLISYTTGGDVDVSIFENTVSGTNDLPAAMPAVEGGDVLDNMTVNDGTSTENVANGLATTAFTGGMPAADGGTGGTDNATANGGVPAADGGTGGTITVIDQNGNVVSEQSFTVQSNGEQDQNGTVTGTETVTETTDGNTNAVVQEPSDEEYDQKDEEEATKKNVSISWTQRSLKIARGYRASFKLNIKTDAKYTIKWHLWERKDGGKVIESRINPKGTVKVGANETATSFRVVAEITLEDGTVLYRRVTVEIVDPKDAPEDNKKLTGTEADDEDEDEVEQDGKDQKEQPKPTENNGNEGGQNNGGSSENESNGSNSGSDDEKKMAEEALKEENKEPSAADLL